MTIHILQPEINKEDRFAVAVPARGGDDRSTMMIIGTYPTKEALDAGYQQWRSFAEGRGITVPYKIELVDETGKCKILS